MTLVSTISNRNISGDEFKKIVENSRNNEVFSFENCCFSDIKISDYELPSLKFYKCKFESEVSFYKCIFLCVMGNAVEEKSLEEDTFQGKWFDKNWNAVWNSDGNRWCLWIDKCVFLSDFSIRGGVLKDVFLGCK